MVDRGVGLSVLGHNLYTFLCLNSSPLLSASKKEKKKKKKVLSVQDP